MKRLRRDLRSEALEYEKTTEQKFCSLVKKHFLWCSVLEARFERILQTALAERAYQYESPGEVGAIKSTQQIFCTTKSEVDPISILGSC